MNKAIKFSSKNVHSFVTCSNIERGLQFVFTFWTSPCHLHSIFHQEKKMTGMQQAEKQLLFVFSLQCTVQNFWGLFHC